MLRGRKPTKKVGALLREYGMSQKRAAKVMCCSPTTISWMVMGEREVSEPYWRKLAGIVGKDWQELRAMSGEDIEPEPAGTSVTPPVDLGLVSPSPCGS